MLFQATYVPKEPILHVFHSAEGSIALDHGKADEAFLSHAHSDHIKGIRKRESIVASDITVALADLKAKPKVLRNTKLLNAGHILGARQLQVEHDGFSRVYTGDFCVRDSIITKGCDIPTCDELIMEATYGAPEYRFPDYADVCMNLATWVNMHPSQNIIIGCYELGKAQELIKVLNDYAKAIPIVTENMEFFCSVYEKHGVPLKRAVVGSPDAEEIMRHPFVALVPMRHAKRYFAKRLSEAFGRETLCAVTTGWALNYRFNVDASFPLSDHADFYDLKSYIEQTGAKKVSFFCGDGSKLLETIPAISSF